jgi:hypothetical protein
VCARFPIARMDVSVEVKKKYIKECDGKHTHRHQSFPRYQLDQYCITIWNKRLQVSQDILLRDRLHSFLGYHNLRRITPGTTKEKLWPGNQKYAKEAAYYHFILVSSEDSKNNRERIHPESISLKERTSLRNIAPEKPVRIGARNVNMAASDNDKCSREK